jgi:predicted transcriptional regulator of viral defense system
MSSATQNVPTPPRDALGALARKATGGLISVADATEALRVSSRVAAARLNRLAAAGWLARVQRGADSPLRPAFRGTVTFNEPHEIRGQPSLDGHIVLRFSPVEHRRRRGAMRG